MKKYIAYYRVSTERQGESGLGLEAQRKTISDHVKSGQIIAEYVEVESGKNNERPELKQAIEQAKKEDAILLIAKLDRLSRSVSFIFSLRDSRVKFECCDIPDASTLTIGIFSTMAQHEREIISSRTKAALASKKARGKQLGNTNNLTNEGRHKGARTNAAKALNNENNQRAKAMAEQLLKSGDTLAKIAETLNKSGFKTPTGKGWIASSIYRLLKREAA